MKRGLLQSRRRSRVKWTIHQKLTNWRRKVCVCVYVYAYVHASCVHNPLFVRMFMHMYMQVG